MVIKQADEIYIVKSSFYTRRMGLVRDDHNCSRSKLEALCQKVAKDLVSAPIDTAPNLRLRRTDRPFMVYDVTFKGKRKRFDLSVYIIHADEGLTVAVNKHCGYLEDHPLDGLIRKRIEQSVLVEDTNDKFVAA